MNDFYGPFLNMESQDRPIFVNPSQLLIKQSSSSPQLPGMEFNIPVQTSSFMGNKQEEVAMTSLEQQQQELFMAQLQQQQLQRQQQQQTRQNQNQQPAPVQPSTQFQQANGYNPYLYNPYYYPPYNYFQQQQPSGGSSTSTSCSSAGCTAAAAAGSSTSTSTSSGGGAASRENPGRKNVSNRQQTTSTTTSGTTRTTRTTTTRTTTTASTTTTTTANEVDLISRPNFGQTNTTRVDTTPATSTNTTGGNNNNNTRPFSFRIGKREANRGDVEEEEPYYDYDLPTNQEGYQFQPPDENFQDQYSQEVVPQQLPQGVNLIPEESENPAQPPINYDYLPQLPNQIVPEAQKPVQDPWQPQDPYKRAHTLNQPLAQQLPPPPPPPPPSQEPLTVEMLMNPSKPYQRAIKPLDYSNMPFQQSRKPYHQINKPTIHPGKPYHPEVKPKYQLGKLQMPPSVSYQKANEPFPKPPESPKPEAESDYIITEEPLRLTPETEAPSSLQTILSSHQVRTNFLKTPPRTEHFGYQTAEHLPTNYQPGNMMTMLTPKKEVEHFPSHYQELAERFYTSSGEVKPRPSRPVSYAEQDPADDRISDEYEDVGSSKVDEIASSKENPLVNTAVIALKLSAKLLDFYKTVSPYLPQ